MVGDSQSTQGFSPLSGGTIRSTLFPAFVPHVAVEVARHRRNASRGVWVRGNRSLGGRRVERLPHTRARGVSTLKFWTRTDVTHTQMPVKNRPQNGRKWHAHEELRRGAPRPVRPVRPNPNPPRLAAGVGLVEQLDPARQD
eukprot:COSAG01_NODE_9173_length_2529_cov_8.300000_1_plen_140_part_10